jgi:transcriptional regulator with XRE-family HTH domain
VSPARALLWHVVRGIGPDGVNRLAETCDVTRSTIYSWLNGYGTPSLAAALDLELRFGISPRAWQSSASDSLAFAPTENEGGEESSQALRTPRTRADRRM